MSLHQQGFFIEAQKLYSEFLKEYPMHFDALHLSGIVAFQLGNFYDAINFYSKALIVNSDFAPLYSNLGNAFKALKLFEDALSSYDAAILIKTDYADAFYNRGVALQELHRFNEALVDYNRAVAINPEFAEAYVNRGIALQDLKRLDEAILSYDRAIIIKSYYVEAINNLGVALNKAERFDEALTIFNEAISIQPNYDDAYYNRGLSLQHQNIFTEALESFDKAILITSGFAEAFSNRGIALKALKRIDEALTSFDEAISHKPDYAEAFYNRGIALGEMRRFEDALTSYQKAILIKPDYFEALNNQGSVYQELKRYDSALMFYEEAIAVKCDYAEALHNRGRVLAELKRFDEALQSYEEAIQCKADFFTAQSDRLFIMSYVHGLSASFRLEEARKFGVAVNCSVISKFISWNTESVDSKLRLGFVSGDFRSHPVGFFLEGALSKLDQSKLSLIAYTNNLQEDELTSRLKKIFYSYKSLVGKNDQEAANLIHDDRIDILIDLSGHTALNRLPVFAYKPAPLQVSWLGYWASTGLEQIDYIVGDPYVTPAEEADHFCEKIKTLPETYLCFTPPSMDIQVKELPSIKNGFVTFGCFNNFSKINKEVVCLWAKVLLAVKGSRLFLKAEQLDDPVVTEETIELFAKFGIGAGRLIFEGRSNLRDYFESYNKIDIALDPFPFPGGTTSVQALWMGVPVLTKKGNRFISHNGETIAYNSGQADWIAHDDADYIAKAIHFSSDLEELSNLRSGLRAKVLTSPLFDAERFARNFENAMFEIWHDYLNRTSGE